MSNSLQFSQIERETHAMSGIKRDKMERINSIRTNLDDRYPPESIVKELFQNAEDAKATILDFGWSAGFPDAEHELLRGPGMFAVNNGPFTTADAWAIGRMGASNKSEEASKIGKFGLGLKSLFHIGEAFFYIAVRDGSIRKADVINPWHKTGHHEDWSVFSTPDQVAMLDHLRALLLGISRGFFLWIPLRQKSTSADGQRALKPYFPGDLPSCPAELKNATGLFFAEHLPLLRHLRQVRSWPNWRNDMSADVKQFDVHIEPGSPRSCFPSRSGSIKPDPGSGEMYEGDRFDPLKISYTMRQGWLEALESFRDRKGWPTTCCAKSGNEHPDKSQPHFAISIARWPSQTPQLTLEYAVFLSLGSKSTPFSLEGGFFYSVKLHACFFVDAGRTAIRQLKGNRTLEDLPVADSIRIEWNDRLIREGLCPLLVGTLKEFSHHCKMTDPDIHILTSALLESKFVGDYRAEIGAKESWLYRRVGPVAAWQVVPVGACVLEIPDWGEAGPGLPGEGLPGLNALASTTVVLTPAGYPRLMAAAPCAWSEASLKAVLAELPASFASWSAAQWDYLNRFLDGVGAAVELPDVVGKLLSWCRQAFVTAATHALRERIEAVHRLVRRIPAAMRVALPGMDDWEPGVRQSVLEWPLRESILILPEGFDPPDARGCGRFCSEDALDIFQWLEPGCKSSLNSTPAIAVSRASDPGIVGEPRFVGLHLWRTERREGGEVRVECLSRTNLDDFRRERRLFRGHSGNLPALTQALALLEKKDNSVYAISDEIAHLLFGPDGVPEFGIESVVGLLKTEPPLKADPIQRVALVRLLIRDSCPTELEPGWRVAMRYLLCPEMSNDSVTILVEIDRDGGVWLQLAKRFAATLPEKFVVVARDPLVRLLKDDLLRQLGLVAITASELSRAITPAMAREMEFDFNDAERDQILLEWQGRPELLEALPLHDDPQGNRCRIDADTFRVGRYSLPPSLVGNIRLIAFRPDPVLAAIQRGLCEELTLARIIEAGLQDGPEKHWIALLESWGKLGSAPLPEPLRIRLRSTAWLPLAEGGFARPANVMMTDAVVVNEEIERLLSRFPGSECRGYADLSGHVRRLAETNALAMRRLCVPSLESALETLSNALAKADPRLSIGIRIDGDRVDDWLAAFDGRAEIAPIRGLLAALWGSAGERNLCAEHFLPGLMPVRAERCEASADRLRELLADLSARHEHEADNSPRRKAILRVFDRYLKAASDANEWPTILRGLRLLDETGCWKPAASLCVGTGLDPKATLCVEQTALLAGKVETQSPRAAVRPMSSGIEPERKRIETECAESADRLDRYLESWKASEEVPAMGGVLASLLGDSPAILDIARKYLPQGQTAAGIRSKIALGGRSRSVRMGPAVQDSPVEMMRIQWVLIDITPAGKTVQVVNLVGAKFDVARTGEVKDLFINYGIRKEDLYLEGDIQVHRLNLLEIDSASVSADRFRQLVEATGRKVLREVFGQPSIDLSEVLGKLAERGNEIRSVQATVCEGSQHILRQLSLKLSEGADPREAKGHDLLKRILEDFARADDRRGEEIEAEDRGRTIAGVLSQDLRKQAIDDFRGKVEGLPGVQKVLREAVRGKLIDSAYRTDSVPFELFQNADDACVEAGTDGTFVLEVGPTGLTVMHDGRAINRPGADGSTAVAARDLRRMVSLGDSDKGQNPDAPPVTGRFGLGFKSVHLVSDEPQLVSGGLSFSIVAAMYPMPLSKDLTEELRAEAKAAGIDEKKATVCRLPFAPGIVAAEVVGRFHALLPYLLVFARSIHRCTRIDSPQGPPRDVRWQARPLVDLPGISVGEMPDPRHDHPRHLLRIARGGMSAVLGLGTGGFERVPDAVPTIWVTAPTTEVHKMGLVLNGPFFLDAGRSQIDRNRKDNAVLFALCGEMLYAGLKDLIAVAASERGRELRRAMGIVGDDPHAIARTLFDSVTRTTDMPDMLRSMLWGKEGAFRRLLSDCDALPTGIELEGHQMLTRIKNVSVVLGGTLDDESADLDLVSTWDSFQSIPAGTVVSGRRVWDKLVKLCPDPLVPVERLDREKLLAREFNLSKRFDIARAGRMGKVVKTDQKSRSDAMHPKAEFCSRAGSFVAAFQLLGPNALKHDDRRDESLRAAFAPADRVLSDDYDADGVEFFRACRGPLIAKVEEMCDWVLGATDDTWIPALVYLRTGERSHALAQQLRRQTVGQGWLRGLTPEHLEQAGYAPEEAIDMLYLLGIWARPSKLPTGTTNGAISTPRLTGKPALEAVAAWWRKERAEQLTDYEKHYVPNGEMVKIIAGAESDRSPEVRKAWLKLFIGGILATIGRTKPEANKGFLNFCDDQDWIDSLLRGKLSSQRWLIQVEKYIDDKPSTVEYFNHLRQFLSISFVARHLSEMIVVFRSPDLFSVSWSMNDLLSNRTSAQFQGSNLDVPGLASMLGLGACVVVRELVRGGVIRTPNAHRFCYPPVRRVRSLLTSVGWNDCDDYGKQPWQVSESIHDFLKAHHFDTTFGGDFDLPLLMLADADDSTRDAVLEGRG